MIKIINWIKSLIIKEKKMDRFEQLRQDMEEGWLSKDEEKLINELEKEFIELKEELKKYEPHPKEKYYNHKYPSMPILYKGRHIPNTKDRIDIDVRTFLNPNDYLIQEIVEEHILPENKTDDEKALECLKWVVTNTKYVSDKKKGHREFWQFPYETLYYMTGDCEDQSILLANLMEASGIPYWKIRLTAGWVKTRNGRGGHAYVVYYCEEKNKWVVLDATYYYNFKKIKDRIEYKKEGRYLSIWFSWNSKYAFSKGLNQTAKKWQIEAI